MFVVEIDEILCYLPSLLLVCLEKRWFRKPSHSEIELPCQIPRIVHGVVHALRGVGTLSVAGIAYNEDLVVFILELRGDFLSDLISSEPFYTC